PARLIGLREELMPLSEFLAETTELGAKRPYGFLPNATGAEAVLARIASPLAFAYLRHLPDVSRSSEARLRTLAEELGVLCTSSKIVHTRQVVLGGLRTKRRLGPYKGVSLRPLTPSERGAFLE